MTCYPAVVAWARRHPDLLSILGIMLVATLLRGALLFRAPVFVTGDSEGYLAPAWELARGLGLDLGKRTPAYPGFVAGVIAVAGEDLRALAFVQHALGVLTAVLTFLLGRLTFGRAVGLGAGMLTALNGGLMLAGQSVMTEALFVPLIVGALAALVAALRARRAWLYVLAGLLLGAATLTRPVAQVLLPLALLAALGCGTTDVRRPPPEHSTRASFVLRRSSVAAAALYAAGFGLALLPWAMLPGDGGGGLGQSLIGRTARHDRGAFTYYDPSVHDGDPDDGRLQARKILQRAAEQGSSGKAIHTRLRRELGLAPGEADRLMRDLAFEAILRDPGYYVRGTLQRFARLAQGSVERLAAYRNTSDVARRDWEHEGTRHLLAPATPAEERAVPTAAALVVLYQPGNLGPILPLLAFVGLAVAALRSEYRPALLVGLAAPALLLASAALVGNVARYRFPADPLIAVMALGALASLTRMARRPGRLEGWARSLPLARRAPPAQRAEGVTQTGGMRVSARNSRQ